ncbi:30S ribosomal protein S4 [Candidatus Dependentiae bacterium]|nr:30S ribosomal protein S4 [Candidatus Dependentiae bacterium]
MEKKVIEKKPGTSSSSDERSKRQKKLTEYGRQLSEKQKVKEMYGMREKQFRRFYSIATKQKTATGETLLSLLERRLDNVIYRAKLANTRTQARQIIVHGHILVNGHKVYSPSYLVEVSDIISLAPNVANKAVFLENVVDKRLNTGVKVPEWIELDKKDRKANILRYPVRSDIQVPIEESLIVELYSK